MKHRSKTARRRKPDTLLALRSACEYLGREQAENGSFYGNSGTDLSSKNSQTKSTFHTSLILHCLHALRIVPQHTHTHIETTVNRAINFLIQEKDALWTWNYWQKAEHKKSPPPQDWDDTAAALSAIALHTPEHISGSIMATITKLFLETEATPGRYHTWIVSKRIRPAWLDIDPIVNAAIGYFLATQGISLSALHSYAEQTLLLRSSSKLSTFYTEDIVRRYFLIRFHSPHLPDKEIQKILKQRNSRGLWKDDLQTALAVSTLLRLGSNPNLIKPALRHIAHVCVKKSWKAHPLYVEEIHNGVPTLSGSTSLTAAFCLEALCLSIKAVRDTSARADRAEIIKKRDTILAKSSERLKNDTHLHIKTKQYIQKLTKHDSADQISVLPLQFARACGYEDAHNYALSMRLGVANVQGWLAYRIYDHLLDNEGSPDDLPIANIALRQVQHEYTQLLGQSSRVQDRYIADCILDEIEYANSWERRNCFVGLTDGAINTEVVPDYAGYDVLAQKSFGHALGPLTILIHNGYTAHSLEFMHIRHFFRHYLIARQLNDDAHDWLADLRRGFFNSASVMVIKEWRKQHPDTLRLPLFDSEKELQKIFWYTCIDSIANDMYRHISEAKQQLADCSSVKKPDYLLSLLEPIEQSARKAQSERSAMLEFLKYY